jgi:hypothetical protein
MRIQRTQAKSHSCTYLTMSRLFSTSTSVDTPPLLAASLETAAPDPTGGSPLDPDRDDSVRGSDTEVSSMSLTDLTSGSNEALGFRPFEITLSTLGANLHNHLNRAPDNIVCLLEFFGTPVSPLVPQPFDQPTKLPNTFIRAYKVDGEGSLRHIPSDVPMTAGRVERNCLL